MALTDSCQQQQVVWQQATKDMASGCLLCPIILRVSANPHQLTLHRRTAYQIPESPITIFSPSLMIKWIVQLIDVPPSYHSYEYPHSIRNLKRINSSLNIIHNVSNARLGSCWSTAPTLHCLSPHLFGKRKLPMLASFHSRQPRLRQLQHPWRGNDSLTQLKRWCQFSPLVLHLIQMP